MKTPALVLALLVAPQLAAADQAPVAKPAPEPKPAPVAQPAPKAKPAPAPAPAPTARPAPTTQPAPSAQSAPTAQPGAATGASAVGAGADGIATPLSSGIPLADPPPTRVVKSLRDEAARVAADRAEAWNMPGADLGLEQHWDIGRWTRTGRAAKLHNRAAAATFIGEMILGLGGSPIAALGAFATGATLDAAAADAEADAAARRGKR